MAVVEGLEEDGSPRRCVHRVNGCWRKPGLNIQRVKYLRELDPSEYSHPCKECWPAGCPPAASSGEMDEGDAESTSSSVRGQWVMESSRQSIWRRGEVRLNIKF